MGDALREGERSKNQRQLEKYEAWIREVEKRQAELAKSRTLYLRVFYVLPFVSLLAFAKSLGAGAAALFTALLMTLFGVYAVLVREGDYELNLKHTRRTAAELRKACAAEKQTDARVEKPIENENGESGAGELDSKLG